MESGVDAGWDGDGAKKKTASRVAACKCVLYGVMGVVVLKYGVRVPGAWGLGPGYASYVQYVNGVLYAIRAGSYGFGQRIAKRKQEATACKEEEEEKKEKRQSWSDEASSRTGQDRTGQTGQGRQGRQGRTRQGGVSTLPTLHMCRDEAGLRGRELAGSRVCRWKREMASKEGRRQGSGEKSGKSNEGGPRDWVCRHGHYNTYILEYLSTYIHTNRPCLACAVLHGKLWTIRSRE